MPLPENRLLIVEPGDVLVIGHAPNLTTQQADQLKEMLGLKAVITLPGIVDLATIRTDEQKVQVVVTGPPEMADQIEAINRAVRTQRGGR